LSRAAASEAIAAEAAPTRHVCYSRQLASNTDIHMIETNPILAQIADLRGRVESLRGYL
jgi:hypothetical protein